MKKTYSLVSKKAIVLLILLIGVFVYSCRKDKQEKLTEPTIIDQQLLQAKRWYDSTYSIVINSKSNLKVQTTRSTSTGATDYSQLIKPDWQHASSYNRFNKKVIEIPVDALAKFSSTLINMSTNKTSYKKEYSRSSFILLNDGKNYEAYIMTVLADSAYVKNDLSKLTRNTYSKRDPDFSGMVLYFTPKGKFISGWLYKNGYIVTSPNNGGTSSGTKVQSAGNSKVKPLYQEAICYDYWLVSYTNGIEDSRDYLYTSCEAGDGGGGGGGDSGGGNPHDGGGSAPPYSPPPCAVAGSSIGGQLRVQNVPADPTDPGDGGFPQPYQCIVESAPNESEPPPEGFRPLCKSSIVLSPFTSTSKQVNMANAKFGITDLPSISTLYQTKSNVIEFNLFISIPNHIRNPSYPTEFVDFTDAQLQQFIYKAYHYASEMTNLTHGQDFFAVGAQPKYSTIFAGYVEEYLNTIALGGMFPGYQNSNGIPSIGARTSTQIDPSKATLTNYTVGTSGEGC